MGGIISRKEGKDSRKTSWRRQHLAFILRGHSLHRKQNHHRHVMKRKGQGSGQCSLALGEWRRTVGGRLESSVGPKLGRVLNTRLRMLPFALETGVPGTRDVPSTLVSVLPRLLLKFKFIFAEADTHTPCIPSSWCFSGKPRGSCVTV